VLGIWIEQTEGAKFWLKVFNELRSRGVGDILIAVVDGLKGLAEKPQQLDGGIVAGEVASATAEAAREALEEFADGPWGSNPTIVQSWRRAWENGTRSHSTGQTQASLSPRCK
jgi:transposase-like protein